MTDRRSSSSNSSTKSRWATPADWEAHREHITRLYQDRTLKETMEVMLRDYGFSGTTRMYKSRIKAWDLRKNRGFGRVKESLEQLVACSQGDAVIDVKRYKELAVYIRRLPLEQQGALVRLFNQIRPDITPRRSLAGADDLYRTEGCLYHLQNHIVGLFDNHLFDGETAPVNHITSLYTEWYHATIVAQGALRFGRTVEAFKVIQPYFDQYQEVLLTHDPRLFGCTSAFAALISLSGPELGNAMLSYAQQMAETMYGPYHPYCKALKSLAAMAVPERRAACATLLVSGYQMLRKQLTPGAPYELYTEQDCRAAEIFILRNDLGADPGSSHHYRVSKAIFEITDLITSRDWYDEQEQMPISDVIDTIAEISGEVTSPPRDDDPDETTVDLQWRQWDGGDSSKPEGSATAGDDNSLVEVERRHHTLAKMSMLADLEQYLTLNGQTSNALEARRSFEDSLVKHCEKLKI
ncbi:hypothetical protein PFICI_04714 [Pestalotiopsis fici W106-1]|uniref:Clr5 domain-containing protein n=1 Tax=Pestalotiopsis fici (strain W106-1 / CGMCC3.15140) TaxID=1229662 RepID=W3X9P9_PESFW|nr:uncharacterized protein PFICI_04714 [Pestalotiopsis fici W106-1]ETS82838.1 hypothetical protein PFICI_04714 [Pestalotiopsis fici W106-1]